MRERCGGVSANAGQDREIGPISPMPDALDFLAELSRFSPIPDDRRQRVPLRQDPQWPALWRHLVERRGLADVLVELCRDLGLVHADQYGNLVFVRRNAAGKALGADAGQARGSYPGRQGVRGCTERLAARVLACHARISGPQRT